jgi:hypothetical protein
MAYQMFIARLFRVYYMHPPLKYMSLGEAYPFIQVRQFAEFFEEYERIVAPPEGRPAHGVGETPT